ncbi:MAG TPA: hypothetical protein VJH94_05155 [Candidatus Paceibacterota bacterium]
MKRKRSTSWFLEPLDIPSNYALAKLITEENCCPSILCADGKQRDLWKCDHSVVQRFQNNATQFRLRIFVQTGKFGKIRPWKFGAVREGKALAQAA